MGLQQQVDVHAFFGTRTVEKGGVVASYCPAISARQTVPSAPQRYPGSCRNRAIPAKNGNSGGLLQKSDEANGHKITRSSSGSRRG
jgi:hypothetical protein